MSKETNWNLIGWNKINAIVALADSRNMHSFYILTTNHFFLHKYLRYKESVFVKKQNHSLIKLYSIYQNDPESFLDKTDADEVIHHNVRDISQFHHQLDRVSGSSNKDKFANNLFRFCSTETKQR